MSQQGISSSIGAVRLMHWYGATGGVLDETSGNGTLVSEYIFFNGKRVARRDADNSVKYYFADNLGSGSVITNSTGTITDESDYYPYGGEIVITNGDSNHYKFTGKERDSESGLDNFGARYYARSLGRFMTPDWAARPTAVPYGVFGDPQSLNLYTYVENAPINRVDADGHSPFSGIIGVGLYGDIDPMYGDVVAQLMEEMTLYTANLAEAVRRVVVTLTFLWRKKRNLNQNPNQNVLLRQIQTGRIKAPPPQIVRFITTT